MVKFSYNELVYADEPIEESIKRVSRYGYDGIELAGENPTDIDTAQVNSLLEEHQIEVSSICGIYTEDRDLSSPNEELRQGGIRYLKNSIDLAAAVDADIVGVGPNPVNKIYPDADIDTEWQLAIDSISVCADYAEDVNVKLAIEPWNRYETYFINRLDEAADLANKVDRENVGVRCDLFHMNIEEDDPIQALRSAGGQLIHVHVADTTRAAPGRGHFNWKDVVSALKYIGYDDYITFELLPAAADPFRVLEGGEDDGTEFYDQYTEEAITVVRDAWETTVP